MSFIEELNYKNINTNENQNIRPLSYEKDVKTFSEIESKRPSTVL
jgi:hypothetical protein